MDRLDDITRLTILRLDAEIRACRYQIALKRHEADFLSVEQERWKEAYRAVLQRVLEERGLDLTQYTFDDETGILRHINKES